MAPPPHLFEPLQQKLTLYRLRRASMPPTDLLLSPRIGITRTSQQINPGADRIWIGNDESQRNHHAPLSLSQPCFSLALGWRARRHASIQPVGTFELDLHRLLAADLIRPDGEFSVRVRFAHLRDGGIVLQRRLSAPRVVLARIDWTPHDLEIEED